MDPLTLLGLSAAALAALSAADRQRAEKEKTEAMVRVLLGLVAWHFALSWDWEPYWITVTAPALAAAKNQLVADGHYDEDDHKYRTYAVIKGGRALEDASVVPDGALVHFVWQAERDIDLVQVVAPRAMTADALADVAWTVVGEGIKGTALECGVARFAPDLMVQGGIVVYEGSLIHDF